MTEGNAAQRAYWNQVAGPRWVGLGGFVENKNREVNDLLLARMRPAAGEHALEIGCGTGATTVPVAEAVGAGGHVLGVDLSEPMLAVARRQVAEAGLRNVELLLADAQVHGFEPGRFDLVYSRFGVMFFADPFAAFRNLGGALKPGGRLAFACWAPLEENPHWLISYDIALRHLGPPAPKSTREPGPLALADPDYVRDILAQAGFDAIAIDRQAVDMVCGTPSEETHHACIMGPTARLIDEKKPDEATRQAIAREVEAAFVACAARGPIRLPATIFLVAAGRPGGVR
jgi:SAM-dependent methyltransferase